RLVAAVIASSVAGLVVDSVVFLWLAFGSLDFLEGQIIGKAWMVLLSIPFIAWLRRRDERLRIAPASYIERADDERRTFRYASARQYRHHHDHAFEEGHQAVLDARAEAAHRARAAGRSRLYAALHTGARGPCYSGELGETDFHARRDRSH